jgi:hypothetical protein
MRFIGALLALVCATLGVLQVWSANLRHAAEFAPAAGAARSIMTFQFAASPARLRELLTAAGERGRLAVLRCLDIDQLIIAGYLFAALGLGGFLTAVSRPGLGRWVIGAALVAALFDLVENSALRQAIADHPGGGSTAPIAAVAAAVKLACLAVAAAAVFLWPLRTWFA